MNIGHSIVAVMASVVGWLLAQPLLAIGDHLLSSVSVADAAPMATTLPLAITRPWRWALRCGLAIGGLLLSWRIFSRPVTHVPLLLDISVLIICMAALALTAAIDGASHLIFMEILILPVVLLALVGLIEGRASWIPMLAGTVIAGGGTWAIYLLGRMVYQSEALGFGDVQLAAVCGSMLGWPYVMDALILGLLLMALITLALLVLRRITMQSYLPIGAFLALGALLLLFTTTPPWW